MRSAIRLKHGEEFEAEMMRAAYGRMINSPQEQGVSSTTVTFANSMRHWFDLFDTEADPTFALKHVEENDFPVVEWKVAMCFLAQDSGSPYYLDVSKGRPDDSAVSDVLSRMKGSDTAVATGLARAKNAALPFILVTPEMGRPLRG
jgi:hypothetical protein